MVHTAVRIWLHDSGTRSHPFGDDIIDGKFYNFGVQALAALKAHKTIDVHYPEMDGDPAQEIIIPYHAVLEWSVEKEEDEYTKPEDDFCKSESTPTGDGITLLDGTYEFEDEGGIVTYNASLDKCYSSENVTVTVDGTTATLPEFANNMYYGEFEGEDKIPVFTTYPAAVVFGLSLSGDGMMLAVAVPTAGSHTVKVTVPNGSEAECSR